jgi:uncharacterized membrane protein YccC
MPIKNHLEEALRISSNQTAFHKNLLSCLAMTIPLIIGYQRGEMFISMFGGLMGLVYFLNDHYAPIKERIVHLVTCHIFFMLALIIGAFCIGQTWAIAFSIFLLSFFVGYSKGHGPEIERLSLFVALEFLTASSDPVIKKYLGGLILYSHLTLTIYFIYIISTYFFYKNQKTNIEQKVKSKRETLKKFLQESIPLKFPLLCSILATCSFIIFHHLKFSHIHWIIGTALIVMLPDSIQGIYKSWQRVIGTLFGVVLASLILSMNQHPLLIIASVGFFSFQMPKGLAKNYWVGNVHIAALIILFLEFALPHSVANHHLAFWRFIDILIGSIIGILCSLILKPSLILRRLN